MVYSILKNIFFALDAEKAHDISLKWLKIAHRIGMTRYFSKPCAMPCKALGLDFKNPVGLAAGFDKNGDYLDALSFLGFGFIELGTVTPRPQAGNPFPRLFRLPEYRAVINRMGFNNNGVDYLVSKIKTALFSGIIGVNIGKNLTTDIDNAHKDYLYCFQKAYPYADYVAINISSPNTPGLRKLQLQDHLESLLDLIKTEQDKLFKKHHKYVPVVVKIAPDLSDAELFSFVRTFKDSGLDGIIATNTTLSREGVEASNFAHEPGGLSGEPLRKRAAYMLKELKSMVDKKTTLIASGGIMTARDAVERMQAGASLVQLYTGLIYSGPGLVKKATKEIRQWHQTMM
ncbi:MAG: quinone-dependent dihydroorotate dehydrogenase [Desulfobacterales bacterium]